VLFAIPLIAQSCSGAPEIATFWTAYVDTRPLGASFADWLALPPACGGIGLGTGLFTVLDPRDRLSRRLSCTLPSRHSGSRTEHVDVGCQVDPWTAIRQR